MLQPEIVVGILSFAGTCIGSIAGIAATNRLTNYRIDQLEKKVDKHNNLIERMVKVEGVASSAQKRIDDIYMQMDIPDTHREQKIA